MSYRELAFALIAMLSLTAAAFPAPEITQVSTSVTQGRHARVKVDYHVSEAAIVLCDVMTNVADGVYASIGPERQMTFVGDVGHKVEPGNRSFTWKAGVDCPSNRIADIKVRLTAYPTNRPPSYLVVDLSPDAAERYRYYASAETIPGFPDSDVYRTQKLVMKFIRAKNIPWTMGAYGETASYGNEQPHAVRLRSNYWMAVFETTVGQRAWFSDGSVADKSSTLPLCRFGTYNTLRGEDALYPSAPSSDSVLGKLRARTGIPFDLPSEAQWEYAAKAGHGENLWGDGSEMTYFNLTNGVGLAVCAYTGGTVVRVGHHLPNDFGLYDMMGNVKEACLDWYETDISWNTNGVVNAQGSSLSDGVTAGTQRVCRGGYYAATMADLRPSNRNGAQLSGNFADGFGFRVATTFGLE